MTDADLAMPQWALRHHGDVDTAPGALDFAVNVHGQAPPAWLTQRLMSRIGDLAAYPTQVDDARARQAVARRHGIEPSQVLPLAGSAEGFHVLASLAARRRLRAAVVHPSFTEPEYALLQAGVPVQRVLLDAPYRLDPAQVPATADLVVVGNPTNPTSVLHPREDLVALCRPGRITVVDEAFCDVVDEERSESLAGANLPGLIVLRSLTKTWALAGLRAGYALGEGELLAELAQHRPHWPLGTLQLEAIAACCGLESEVELERIRAEISACRTAMCDALRAADIEIAVAPKAPFVLVRTPAGLDPEQFRAALAEQKIIARRCDTFPGLGPEHLRLAVRNQEMVEALVSAWITARERLSSAGRPAADARVHTGPEKENP